MASAVLIAFEIVPVIDAPEIEPPVMVGLLDRRVGELVDALRCGAK